MKTITGKINTEYLICFVLILLALLLIDTVWGLIKDYRKETSERIIKGEASLCIVKQGNEYTLIVDGDAEGCLDFAHWLTPEAIRECDVCEIYEEWEI